MELPKNATLAITTKTRYNVNCGSGDPRPVFYFETLEDAVEYARNEVQNPTWSVAEIAAGLVRCNETRLRGNGGLRWVGKVVPPKTHIICFSGGHSSALVALEVAARYGTDNMVLLNHNINSGKEDADIKRFKQAIADYLKLPIEFANAGGEQDDTRIPNQFQVSRDLRGFKQPGSGNAFCTFILKTQPFHDYLAANFPLGPDGKNHDCVIYYGFDAEEANRIDRRSGILASMGYESCYPLAHWPSTIEDTEAVGIPRPNTYSVYKHGNCKGCLKGGIQHWYVTYCNEPGVWAEAKATEAHFAALGKPYSILPDQRYSPVRPLYLEALEPVFEAMRADGVPQTERFPGGKFRALLRKYRLANDEANAAPLVENFEAGIACECFSLNEEPDNSILEQFDITVTQNGQPASVEALPQAAKDLIALGGILLQQSEERAAGRAAVSQAEQIAEFEAMGFVKGEDGVYRQ